ncbi:hypothetical protein HG536_0F02960 [Torulaspora globosa]|uniref:DNA/RNA-binding protein Alba-like domain-containing protein n=1 Tax=Torulaspora globosa TaxID=48254 RepID=A0A7G3ZKD5_9SACH|nr:uncharacterized protein HG536_0F02960 [Torulaspora globosa]QLL33971.1 hypothetical protein HG536_0F02960 [Torulaspora globosa]
MAGLPRVQYDGKDARIDPADQESTMKYIYDHIISSCIQGPEVIGDGIISYRKVTKNDNIKQTIDKLENTDCQYICLYSYGQHIQKMLSVVEIFKRILLGKTSSVKQWNRLTCFILTKEGRNELLEKQTRIPILITVVEIPSTSIRPSFELSLKGFTQQ